MRNVLLVVLALLLAGCEHERTETVTVEKVSSPTPPTPPPPPAPPRPVTLDDIILQLQNAADGPSEATALNNLHIWMSDRQLTYTTRVQRADTNQVIAQGASIA